MAKDSHFSEKYFGPNFIVYRCDRSSLTSSKLTDGGVLIAVSSRISSERVLIDCDAHLDIEFVCVPSNSVMFFLDMLLRSRVLNMTQTVCFSSLGISTFQEKGGHWMAITTIISPPEFQRRRQINCLHDHCGDLWDLCFVSDYDIVQLTEADELLVAIDVFHRPFIITTELFECVPACATRRALHRLQECC